MLEIKSNTLKAKSSKQIFIGGSGRSGTTILGHIFNEHPDICYFEEPRFLIDSGGLNDFLHGRITYGVFRQNMLTIFRELIIKKVKGLGFDDAAQMYCQDNIDSILESAFQAGGNLIENARRFLDSLLSIGMRALNKKYWVEKTPNTILMADVLFKIYPNMKYFHIIREPKDIYSSLLTQSWGPKQADKFVEWYCVKMNEAYRAQLKVSRANYYVLSLENLLANAYEVVRNVLCSASIERGEEIINRCVSFVSPEEAHIGRWHGSLSTEEAALIDNGCGELYSLWKQREAETSLLWKERKKMGWKAEYEKRWIKEHSGKLLENEISRVDSTVATAAKQYLEPKQFDLDMNDLGIEIESKFTHTNPPIVQQDTKKRIIQKQSFLPKPSHRGGRQGLTIFTIPRSFDGCIDIIQRNAIRSWTLLEPKPEIILFGHDDKAAEVARKFGAKQITNVQCDEYKIPLLNDLFEKAQAAASNDVLMYVDAGIILLSDFTRVVRQVAACFNEFLMIGRGWDFDVSEEIEFDTEESEPRLLERISKEGVFRSSRGIDYFVFSRGLWSEIPPFEIESSNCDNWLVTAVIDSPHPVIDTSQSVTAIYQNHRLSHVSAGNDAASLKIQKQGNQILRGNNVPFRIASHTMWRLTSDSVTLRPVSEFLQNNRDASLAFRCIDNVYRQAPEMIEKQCKRFVAHLKPDDLAKWLNTTKTVLRTESSNKTAELVLNYIWTRNRPAAEELFKKGLRYMSQGDIQNATEFFFKASKKYENLPNVHFAAAVAFVQLNDLDAAKKACEVELALYPEHDGAKKLLGKIEKMAAEFV